MNPAKKYTALGIGHGINDCVAGFVIGSLFYHGYSAMEAGIYTLAYNLLAFGGQLVVAKIIETHFFPKRNLLISVGLLIPALLILQISPAIAIFLSGVASALFHVTGGLEASREDNKSFGIGIFASPGILGLITGGFLAYIHFDFMLIGISLCAVYALLLWRFYKAEDNAVVSKKHTAEIERHDVIMCILLLVISLRSFVWDVMQMIEQNNYGWLLIIAVAAMCGKIFGGFLADKIGHRKYSIIALLIAMPLLTLLKKNIFAMCAGVFLLQSTIPATTVMILQSIKQKPAIAISLSFGVSILVAITIFYTPLVKYLDNAITISLVLFISVLLLLLHSRMLKSKTLTGLHEKVDQ
jgi:FSR family fosmidomycin resistance protein-like MFS transporter